MSSIIQSNYGTRSYRFPTEDRALEQNRASSNSFRDLVTSGSGSRAMTDVLEISGRQEVSSETTTSNVAAYTKYLEKKYGNLTIESVGRDEESLDRIAKRMSGSDVVIAPNILEDMANDANKALYYEQKIDYFFNTVIPRETAFCAARGLVFEPGGVVVNEDGTVTYICGCSDSPERVAEVNRINAEKAKKKAEMERKYQERAAAAAAESREMWEQLAQKQALEKNSFRIGDLLKTQMIAVPSITPEMSLPSETNMFLLNI